MAQPLPGPDIPPELTFLHTDVVKHQRKGEVGGCRYIYSVCVFF